MHLNALHRLTLLAVLAQVVFAYGKNARRLFMGEDQYRSVVEVVLCADGQQWMYSLPTLNSVCSNYDFGMYQHQGLLTMHSPCRSF